MASNRILLVEGNDDGAVTSQLWKLHHPTQEQPPFKINIESGVDGVKASARIHLKGPLDSTRLNALGIVVDSDVNLLDRWRSMREILINSDYTNVPDTPQLHGTIVTQFDKPRVGIWIMPDNRLPGILEDFISFLVPAGNHLWQIAQHTVASLPPSPDRFADKDTKKAEIHTWLAWQRAPGTPMGTAISKKYLDANSEYAQQYVTWLVRLFVD
jgi:hypothetical protein